MPSWSKTEASPNWVQNGHSEHSNRPWRCIYGSILMFESFNWKWDSGKCDQLHGLFDSDQSSAWKAVSRAWYSSIKAVYQVAVSCRCSTDRDLLHWHSRWSKLKLKALTSILSTWTARSPQKCTLTVGWNVQTAHFSPHSVPRTGFQPTEWRENCFSFRLERKSLVFIELFNIYEWKLKYVICVWMYCILWQLAM